MQNTDYGRWEWEWQLSLNSSASMLAVAPGVGEIKTGERRYITKKVVKRLCLYSLGKYLIPKGTGGGWEMGTQLHV